jgi:stalled ribosome rescue protein Dom34
MKSKVGLWIDHKKAVIVFLTGEKQEIKLINSNVQKQDRRSATSRHEGRFESQSLAAEDHRDRAFMGHLDIYYNNVIASIRDAEAILILGPGEAKGELKKHLETKNLGDRIVAVETVDEMTDPQIAAKVRQYFQK